MGSASLLDRLRSRRWLVDQLRLITPPQHFGLATRTVSRREAVRACLGAGPSLPVHFYVHVPFCEERCTFCKYFERLAGPESPAVQGYVEALAGLLGEALHELGGRPVDALYVGGGTASILTAEQIGTLFPPLAERLSGEAEATYEMSPRSSTPAKLRVLRATGFNRVSFGLQSFDPELLASMHRRPTTPAELGTLIDAAVALGFADINVDLMVGVEGETDATVTRSAGQLFELRPPTVTVYRESRPRPGRADMAGGLEHFTDRVVRPRVASVVELGRALGYRSSPDLGAEQVRLYDSRWPRAARPDRCLYRTRYDPYAETTLIGLGPGAFSFAGPRVFVTSGVPGAQTPLPDRAALTLSGDAEVAASVAVNQLYGQGRRSLEDALFTRVLGRPIEHFFAEELSALAGLGLVERSGGRVRRTCEGAAAWAYADKLFYPEAWVEQARAPGPDGALRQATPFSYRIQKG